MSKAPTWSFGFRTVGLDLTSSHSFKYPMKGFATCDDWIDEDECGGGLHYLKDFQGDFSLTDIECLPGVRCQLLKVNHKYKGKNNIRSIDNGEKYKSQQVQVLGTFLSLKDMKKFLIEYKTTRIKYKKLILDRLEELINENGCGKVINFGEFVCIDNEYNNSIALNGGTVIWNHLDGSNYSEVFCLLDNNSNAVVIRNSECHQVDLSNVKINKPYQLCYRVTTGKYEVV